MCAAAALVISCGSLVYAPGAHIQSQQGSGVTSLSAGVAALPETKPEEAGTNLSGGAELKAAYQFSNVVRLEGNYFTNLRSFDLSSPVHGFGLHALLKLHDADALDWLLSVRTQFLLNADDIEGYGWGAQFGPRWSFSDELHTYALLGPIAGWRDIESEYGYGALANLGLGYSPATFITCSVDLAALAGYDAWASTTRFTLAPSLQLTFHLPTAP